VLPRAGTWCEGAGLLTPVLVLWERCAARWTSAVVVADATDAATGVRRHVWVPPFVGDSPEFRAAVSSRSYAFGRPSAGLAPDAGSRLGM
jgi:hypothetical protein